MLMIMTRYLSAIIWGDIGSIVGGTFRNVSPLLAIV